MDKPIFDRLQEADWGSILKKLRAFTRYRVRHYGSTGDPDTLIAKGMSVDDIVHDVVVKTMHGTRKWDPNKGELLPWLKDQVKSEVDALFRSAARHREIAVPDDYPEAADLLIHSRLASDDPLHNERSETPEDILLRKERDSLRSDTVWELALGDDELEEIVIAVSDGCDSTPRALARYLGVPVEDIYNRLKRLRRRAKDFRRDQDEYH